jgi:hypothetical protein
MANIRCPTSVATACSTCAWDRRSTKHEASRSIILIARSVTRSSARVRCALIGEPVFPDGSTLGVKMVAGERYRFSAHDPNLRYFLRLWCYRTMCPPPNSIAHVKFSFVQGLSRPRFPCSRRRTPEIGPPALARRAPLPALPGPLRRGPQPLAFWWTRASAATRSSPFVERSLTL